MPRDADDITYQPHNIGAEQAVLGAVLVNNAAFWECSDLLCAEDFFEPVHGRIWAACEASISQGRLADAVTLHELFDRDPALREMNGAVYLARLASAAETIIKAAEYARVVARLAKRREVMAAADALSAAVGAGEYAGDQEPLRKARAAIDAMLAGDRDDIVDIATVTEEIIKDSEAGAMPISTGLPSLDQAMGGGYHIGRLYVFNGLSKHFKSGAMMTTACNIATAGVKVGWIAIELDRKLVGQRLIATVGKLDPAIFKHLTADGVEAVIRAAKEMLSLTLVHAKTMTLQELQAKAERMIHEKKCKVLYIDYWQKIAGAGVEGRELYLTRAADWMLSFAEDNNCVVVTGSQINVRTGLTHYGEGLLRAASWQYSIHKADTPLISPTVPGGKLGQVWMTYDVDRHGPKHHLGSEEAPAFWIHPYGPRLIEADSNYLL